MNSSPAASWSRLAPIALIFFIGRQLKEFAQSMIYAIPAMAISVSVSDLYNNTWLITGITFLMISILLSAFLRYWSFRFRVQEQQIEIQSGIISKKHINLPFWRIQNIRIERPWFYRFSSYAVLIIDTAGSASEEAVIVAIKQAKAVALRNTVSAVKAKHGKEKDSRSSDINQHLQYQDTHENTSANSTESSSAQIINTRSVYDLILHGITNNRVWILFGAVSPFLDDVSRWCLDWFSLRGIEPELLMQNMALSWWQWAGIILLGLSIVIALTMLLSVCGAILNHYGFTLYRESERYIRHSGLLSQQEVCIQRSRIQRVSVSQSALNILLKRANVVFEQNKSGQHNDNQYSSSKLLIPSATLSEAASLTSDVFTQAKPTHISFRKINSAFLIHHWFVRLVPLSIMVGVLLNIRLSNFPVEAFLAGVGLVAGLIFIRFCRWGYAIDDKYLYVRKGLLGKTYYTLPLFKLQQVEIQKSIIMRRKHLVHMKVTLASGAIKIPFVIQADALQIMNYALFKCESDPRSWM